jgi:cell wall-associated NlpC family hydrolase
MSEVYVAAGWLPAGLEIPSGPTVWARAQERSLMEEWLDNTPFFARTEPAEAAPGDLLGFRLGCCIHHLALMLPGRRYLHAVQGHGARIVEAIPRVWQRRLAAAWRVILP